MKTILCVVDDSPAAMTRLDYALAVAAQFDSHPVALALAVESSLLFASGVEASPELIAQQIESARATAKAIAEKAEERIRLSGRPGEVRRASVQLSAVADTVARHARYADLTVVGFGVNGDASPQLQEAFDGVLFDSGRPVLVAPARLPASTGFDKVLIAWDGGKQAARAVSDALPILSRAREVAIAVVDPEISDFGLGEEPGADVALYLSRHGLKVDVRQIPSGGRSVSEALTLSAREWGADLVVMGGYGRSQWREFLFGGVSRALLDQSEIPLFMAH
jgi:nucleotide-binding universal stress UspA family protein